eukprot:CAMPEP_0185263114 /NCGR_PEP_ID=MMETSP1359-20130426/11092_1 /TAXON_ID=552665 /ORGANISM="Bigelowiella longifila, Strain CCMP242" /LENGTH=61 /DNA_ID=CAMNT_0027850243 /DNA_START=32 /DNA_END=217 /DNA_ORIENTATION=-
MATKLIGGFLTFSVPYLGLASCLAAKTNGDPKAGFIHISAENPGNQVPVAQPIRLDSTKDS